MEQRNKHLVDEVKKYLAKRDALPFTINSTVRGSLTLRTEQIRLLLEALCYYQSEDEKKMIFRDELLDIFYDGSSSLYENNEIE